MDLKKGIIPHDVVGFGHMVTLCVKGYRREEMKKDFGEISAMRFEPPNT